jgi:hypothetical protein
VGAEQHSYDSAEYRQRVLKKVGYLIRGLLIAPGGLSSLIHNFSHNDFKRLSNVLAIVTNPNATNLFENLPESMPDELVLADRLLPAFRVCDELWLGVPGQRRP